MQDIRPFRGWRFSPSFGTDISALVAPPYDVISPAQQQRLYDSSPHNVIRVELTAAERADGDAEAGQSNRHARARSTLDQWRATGVLQRDIDDALYLYSQMFTSNGRTYTRRSIIAAVRLAPWSSGLILPHERTLSAPRAERLGLMRATGANLSPIWALFHDENGRVTEALDAAQASPSRLGSTIATMDGVEHRLDVVAAPHAIKMLCDALNEARLYIADGHHRYETALAYSQARHDSVESPARYVMMVLTDAAESGLVVLPTHRLIHSLDAKRLSGLQQLLEQSFEVNEAAMPDLSVDFSSWVLQTLANANGGGHVFGLLGARAGFMSILKPRESALATHSSGGVLASLTVWMAQKLVLEDVLGLTDADIESEKFLRYTRDASQARSAVEDGSAQLALMLPATPVPQLLDVANAGKVMPQKSTYFYPKPATGMVIRLLDEW